jgi:hypothetical protein
MLVSRFGFSSRAVSPGEAAVVFLVEITGILSASVYLCMYVCRYVGDVRLGPYHRVYWRGLGRISFRGTVGGWP